MKQFDTSETQMNLEGKKFISVVNTSTGEVGKETVFCYHQQEDVVWAEYEGGQIAKGHLIAKVIDGNKLDMRYHHVNTSGELMLGKCISEAEFLPDGRIMFKENWQWISGDQSTGYSEIIEIKSQ